MRSKAAHITAFSLLELLIVVVILSILSAVVVPLALQTEDDTNLVAAQSTLDAWNKKIQAHMILEGEWPQQLERNWFVANRHPKSPWAPTARLVDSPATTDADLEHPVHKNLSSNAASFWYNPNNGILRIRVPLQSTPEAALELYNSANKSNAKQTVFLQNGSPNTGPSTPLSP